MKLSKRPKSIGQFIIDLTPLLDVVFIMLIVVLSFQDNYSQVAENKMNDAKQIEEEAKDYVAGATADLETVEEQLETYAQINDSINVLTVYASYEPSNRKYRKIHLVSNEKEMDTIELNPSNGEIAWGKCREIIEGILMESPDKPLIISTENQKMLYRDEQSIDEMINSLNEYNNIYRRINSENGNE